MVTYTIKKDNIVKSTKALFPGGFMPQAAVRVD